MHNKQNVPADYQIPPTLPYELVKLKGHEFTNIVIHYLPCLKQFWTIEMISELKLNYDIELLLLY